MNVKLVRLEDIADEAPVREAAAGCDAVFVMPFIDRAMAERSARQLAGRAQGAGLVLAVEDVHRLGFVAIANLAFRATTSTFFGYVAQDCFSGRRWLARALSALSEPDAGLLGFNDGKWSGALASFGMVRRTWAQGNYGGDLFFPGYVRHFADAELTVLAMQARRYCYDPECLLIEVDWEKERSPVNPADRALYRERAAGGFEGRVRDTRLLSLFS